VKIPKFNFEKFPGASNALGTAMRSVGEVMAMGRTFNEAFLKALRSLEVGRNPIPPLHAPPRHSVPELEALLKVPTPERVWAVFEALACDMSCETINRLTHLDLWFLRQWKTLVDAFREVEKTPFATMTASALRRFKHLGFSDAMLAQAWKVTEKDVRVARARLKVHPVYKRVDTCAAEFEAYTPYLYSTYDEEDEAPPTTRQKIMILGSGPIRIGQGIEFDYCCVHAAFALREAGFETIMVNCNPETVSTDYDTSDRLYFEPLTLEDVLEVVRREKPLGVIVQFGGQTPLRISQALEAEGVRILGTSPDAIDIAEDRERFSQLVEKLRLRQPENGTARSEAEAFTVAHAVGYPVMVRPSYVLGGRAMEVVRDDEDLSRYMREAVRASPEHPVLIDRFLANAIEVDLDLVRDFTGFSVVGGILEHVEEAGVHSGDAASVMPPHSLPPDVVERLKDIATALADELKVVGLMNVQFAVQGKAIYVLEVNPRASRTVPFISKATGLPLARVASLCMAGKSLKSLGIVSDPEIHHVAVKESVFPFARFSNTDIILGPEMKSTGEVMGLDAQVNVAFGKSQLASGIRLPAGGIAFLSVKDDDKPSLVDLAKRLRNLGFSLLGTDGTQHYLQKKGIASERINKVLQGSPHIVEALQRGDIAMVINTTAGKKEIADSYSIRRESLLRGVPNFTTIEAARMVVGALEAQRQHPWEYRSLQRWLQRPSKG
jgi:carbamoyl-phosphate synthase large subunit